MLPVRMRRKTSNQVTVPASMPAVIVFAVVFFAAGTCQAGEYDRLPGNRRTASAGSVIADTLPCGKLAQASARFVINAPQDAVWQVLTDFPQYPHIFTRLQSCRITRRQGDLVWTESYLKPHMFVRKQRQHTVNDLSLKPNALNWRVIDGNFKTVIGKWELAPAGRGDRCSVIYTLFVDPGPIMPKFLVSFALRNLQKEIISALKEWVETTKLSSRTSFNTMKSVPPI